MIDDLPVTAYATPRLIAAGLAAGAALTGVARWFMRPPPDKDRGLKDPDVQRLIASERRRDLQQRRESGVGQRTEDLEAKRTELQLVAGWLDLKAKRTELQLRENKLAAAEERLSVAQMTLFEERERRDFEERPPSPQLDESEFMHVTCCDVPRTPTPGLAAHLQTQTGDLPYDRVVAVLEADCDIHEAMRHLALHRASCVRVGQQGVMDVTDAAICLLQPELATVRQPVATALRTCASVGPSLTMQVAIQYLKQGYDYLTVRGRDEGIISQAGVLRWLHKFLADSPEDAAPFETVMAGDLGSEPLTCPADTTARVALRSLLRTRARSLALTDDGAVVGVLSVSDIKCFSQAEDVDLEAHAIDFVRASRALVRATRPVDEIVSATQVTSALEVLRLLVTEDVHSVYIMDGSQCTNVVTTTDLLRCLV